ncbi:MAG: WXG100 family type VII secretion target [Oscillospiraceae bacterium]|nr:WXG100 family type VII secretion target [Oscillospiraceae bacterium]
MEIKIDPKSVKNHVEEIRAAARQYQQMEDQMFADGRDLDTKWDGAAADKFGSKMKNEEPYFDELFTIAEQWCKAIDDSADDYAKTDSQVSDSVSTRI